MFYTFSCEQSLKCVIKNKRNKIYKFKTLLILFVYLLYFNLVLINGMQSYFPLIFGNEMCAKCWGELGVESLQLSFSILNVPTPLSIPTPCSVSTPYSLSIGINIIPINFTKSPYGSSDMQKSCFAFTLLNKLRNKQTKKIQNEKCWYQWTRTLYFEGTGVDEIGHTRRSPSPKISRGHPTIFTRSLYFGVDEREVTLLASPFPLTFRS